MLFLLSLEAVNNILTGSQFVVLHDRDIKGYWKGELGKSCVAECLDYEFTKDERETHVASVGIGIVIDYWAKVVVMLPMK